MNSFVKHKEFHENANISIPKFMSSAEEFIQFLYDLNIISYFEQTENGEPFIHWCFKDRTYSNISPKIKTDATYEIFYGLSKALNTGTKFIRNKA